MYIDDKTFGQCPNSDKLEDIYWQIKLTHPEFQGFIVQTTANMVLKADLHQWRKANIKFVEMGLETANNDLLARYKKPHRIEHVKKAMHLLESHFMQVILNVILGLPGESKQTYQNTIDFILWENPIALNIYTLALYADSELGKEIESKSEDDTNELSEDRTFWTESEKQAYNMYSRQLYELGIALLKGL